ncbi:hypothetical protein MBLNU459_g3292t1 [Dothideomycetes sp. NU459]
MVSDKQKPKRLLIPWIYDLALWVFTFAVDIFFREVYPRNSFRVPKTGPVIIVAAPHANQFVDCINLMRILKQHANRRVSFLIAEKSMKEPYIGTMAGCMGALPVARAMDNVRPGKGTVYLPNLDDPTLIRGVETDFTHADFMPSGTLILAKTGNQIPANQIIANIIGPEELRLKKPFETPEAIRQLTAEQNGIRGTTFKVAPHLDHSRMFDAVSHELSAGGCIGIFPEGGSHDRSDLLPFKAGVAIMALNTLARDPDCGLSIIPCGLNYFHAHKFRSRAVMEFGSPIEVHPDQINAYKIGGVDKRNAIGSLLETIYEGLATVTQPSPDHETLLLAQATRRLYNPIGKKLPLPVVIEWNRRLLAGYTKFHDDPRVVQVKKAVIKYNKHLLALGIKDHQVEWGNVRKRPWLFTLGTLLYRLGELVLLSLGTLPGLFCFWPVFVICKIISVKKRRKALANSVVKLQGHDVVATWKMLVALGLAPALYLYNTATATIWLYYNRQNGYYTSVAPWWLVARSYIPDSIPLWRFAVVYFVLMIIVSFAALRLGEIGVDIIKSLPPLFVALNPRSTDSLIKLRAHRAAISSQVKDVINTLGPEVFPEFDAERIAADTHKADAYQSRLKKSE